VKLLIATNGAVGATVWASVVERRQGRIEAGVGCSQQDHGWSCSGTLACSSHVVALSGIGFG